MTEAEWLAGTDLDAVAPNHGSGMSLNSKVTSLVT